MSNVNQVQRCEQRLLTAMLAGDVTTLASLIDDQLVFTGPDGNLLSKAADLAAYRSGLFQLSKLEPMESAFHPIADFVLSTSKAALSGSFGDVAFSGTYAYTRLWVARADGWRVIAGHVSMLG